MNLRGNGFEGFNVKGLGFQGVGCACQLRVASARSRVSAEGLGLLGLLGACRLFASLLLGCEILGSFQPDRRSEVVGLHSKTLEILKPLLWGP